MKKKKDASESGEIVIESTFVVTICIFLLMTMLSMGMYLYQTAVVRVTAEKTASDMAMVYPHIKKDPYYNYTNYYDFTEIDPYRGMLLQGMINWTENTRKAEWYAFGLLDRYSIRKGEYKDARIDVEIKNINFTSKGIYVTVTDEYVMPFSGSIFGFAGLPEKVEITASASARVVDMSNTMATWKFVIALEDKVLDTFVGKCIPAITKWIDFANRLING